MTFLKANVWQRVGILLGVSAFLGMMLASYQFSLPQKVCNGIVAEKDGVHSETKTTGWAFSSLYKKIQTIQYRCADMKLIGNLANPNDGAWTVCFDNWVSPPGCQVYSFGINNDFTFDDHINNVTGCTVHSFDPTMNTPELVRGTNKFFHPIAIGAKSDDNYTDGDIYSAGAKGVAWKVRTLSDLRQMYDTKSLPIIKIDTEFNEWASLDNWLQTPGALDTVEQILVEVHFWPQFADPQRYMDPAFQLHILQEWTRTLEMLYTAGFRVFNVHTNPYSSMMDFGLGFAVPCCFEVSYIRVKTKPMFGIGGRV